MENSKTENTSSTKNETHKEEQETTPFEKIIQLNKLGALFLSNDKYEKALSILKKTFDFYLEKKKKQEIPNFFYSNLYCNLAKTYSCLKDFKNAQEIYTECIMNNSLYKILLVEKEFMNEIFLIDIEKLLDIENLKPEHLTEIEEKYEILMEYFNEKNVSESQENFSIREEFLTKILKRFKPNNLNSLSSFTDSLVNLAVIFQYFYKESITSFNMYYLAILLDQSNVVANVDFNNFLRENNMKEKSDEFIIRRITYDYFQDDSKDYIDIHESNKKDQDQIKIKQISAKKFKLEQSHSNENETLVNSEKKISFVCMKWGTKYNSEYVNKLYRGLRCNTNREFKFFCITDDFNDLVNEIIPIELKTDFKGWMRKSILFSDYYVDKFTQSGEEYICFIDLDMIVYNSIEFIWNYHEDFCLMKTDDIQCENSVNGYNSSIILWRKDFGKEIYQNMALYSKYFTCQVVRFDHYLEFVIKNSDFVQDIFPGKVLDYNTYCKGKEELPESGAIIAFPRYPKPHECKEEWVKSYWK